MQQAELFRRDDNEPLRSDVWGDGLGDDQSEPSSGDTYRHQTEF